MKYFPFLITCSLLFLLSCNDDDDATFVCNDFGVGDTISVPVPQGNAFLRIDAVFQENRCACNAFCITAGGTGFRLLTPENDTLLIGIGDQTIPPDTVRYQGELLRLVSITHREVCSFSDLTEADYCAEFVFE
ncbi:MAG: hypothetical protein ACI81P_001137 [Neolewinella sp.]|jgi:hypothetical protein